MGTFAVTAIGQDRPGIVAGIAEALLAVGGNIEDSRMAILRGHFAVMLIVTVPPENEREIGERLEQARDRLELEALTVAEVDELDARPSGAADHVLTVYGADHPGIVHAVSSALAGHGVNICNLQTQVAGRGEQGIYVMLIEVAIGDADHAEVAASLDGVAREAGVDVSLRELEAEAL